MADPQPDHDERPSPPRGPGNPMRMSRGIFGWVVFIIFALFLVVLLLTTAPWLSSRWQPRDEVAIPGDVEQPRHPQPAEQLDVEALIAREGRSARLLAAAQMLATEPGLEEYQRQAERYLAEAYRGTAAVNGALPPTHSPPNKEPE